MALVITVAQQKGGAGKTTLAANLAAAFAEERRVAVVDIDPQGSLTRWHGLRAKQKAAAPITLTDVSGWRLKAELESLQRQHDIVIVDSPPQIDTDAKLAIRAADLVLVPVQPSPVDLWAAEGTLKLATAEGRTVGIVLNRSPASGKLKDAVVAEIGAQGYPVLDSVLGNRVGFAGAFARGLGVTETAPKSVAARELLALLEEILETLK